MITPTHSSVTKSKNTTLTGSPSGAKPAGWFGSFDERGGSDTDPPALRWRMSFRLRAGKTVGYLAGGGLKAYSAPGAVWAGAGVDQGERLPLVGPCPCTCLKWTESLKASRTVPGCRLDGLPSPPMLMRWRCQGPYRFPIFSSVNASWPDEVGVAASGWRLLPISIFPCATVLLELLNPWWVKSGSGGGCCPCAGRLGPFLAGDDQMA